MPDNPALMLVAIGMAGAACQWLAWRTRLPAILFLLLTGLLAGPVSGLLEPDVLFGDLLFPLVSLAVAVILFEGSLTLRLEDVRGLEQVVRRLVGVGSLISGATAALAAHWLVGFDWPLAALFGAIMVVTGPTVIVPMLRTVRPSAAVANVLRWEGIVIDPLGALFTVLVFEIIVASQAALGHAALMFLRIMLVGTLSGLAAGWLLGTALRHYRIPEYLHNVAVLNAVVTTFVLANLLAEEAGLLAVTLMGIVLANMRGVPVHGILDFKESLSMLLISALFVLLAARIDLADFALLGWGALGVLAALQFIGRPLKVLAATWGSELNWRERILIAWIGPRGIVAAAIAALFALHLEEMGMAQATLVVPLTFTIIVGTVMLQGLTARPLAQLLGVAEPEPRGILIAGANGVARAVASALQERGFPVLLADADLRNINAARMAGLPTFYGHPLSEYADRKLELVGIGRLLALTPEPEQNALTTLRYARELGVNNVFLIARGPDTEPDARRHLSTRHSGRALFSADTSYEALAGRLAAGERIHATRLSESFAIEDLYHTAKMQALPLFAVDPQGLLHVYSVEQPLQPGPDWTILSLMPEERAAEQSGGEPAVGDRDNLKSEATREAAE